MNPERSTGEVRIPHRRVALANGLEVIVVESRNRPVISIDLLLRAGSGWDPEGGEGCASLTAGLLNQGSRRRDADEMAAAIDRLGAIFSAASGLDALRLGIAGLRDDFSAMLDLIAEMALAPTFAPEAFERMRARHLNALSRAVDHPAILADWTFLLHLFARHPYGHPPRGLAPTVARLAAGDVAAFHARHFAPAGSFLAIAGGATAEEAVRAVEGVFGAWTGSRPETDPPPPVGLAAKIVTVHRPGLTQAQIRWGHAGLPRSAPEYDAAVVMNYSLGGGGFSSRLMKRIRSERGLTYGIQSALEGHVLAGSFVISTSTPSESVDQVLQDIVEIVEAYRAHGPTAEELAAAKARMAGGYPLLLETPAQAAGRLLDAAFHGLPEDSVETYPRRVQDLRPAEVAAIAGRLLQPEGALLVLVGDMERLRFEGERFGPIERFDPRSIFGGGR